MFKKVYNLLLDLLFPLYCCGCSKEGELLCQTCLQKLKAELPLVEINPTPHVDQVIIFCNFRHELISSTIHAFKYGGITSLASIYASLMAENMPLQIDHAAALVPIPLHRLKRNARGYNQSELISVAAARRWAMPLDTNLIRARHTRVQARLKRQERFTNVADAFRYAGTAPAKTAYLIDDLTTTGATLEAAAVELKKNGYETVIALVLAKNEQ